MRRSVALAVVVTLLMVPWAGAAPANAREAPAMEMDAAIRGIDIALQTGHVLAGSLDPDDGSLGAPRDADAWALWEPDGDLLRTDDADPDGCSILAACRGDVVDVAISSNGDRIVVAAKNADGPASRVLFITPNQGEVHRETFGDAITSLAVNRDGTRIVVGSLVDPNFGADTGMVTSFSWTGASGTNPGTVSELWQVDTDEPVTAVAVSQSGRASAAATSDHYRITATGTATIDDNIEGNAVSVAYAYSSPDRWSVAGSGNGGVLLYDADSDVSPFAPALNLRPGSASQTAVAIDDAGDRFAAADANGRLRLFNNIFRNSGSTLIATTPALDGAVRDIDFSADGRYIAVAAGQSAYLYRASAAGLVQYWAHDLGAAARAVAITADGNTVVAAAGSKVTVFERLVDFDVDAPASITTQPDEAESITFTYRNDGNRDENLTFAVDAPTGWSAAVAPQAADLAPGASVEVELSFTVPPLYPAGDKDINLRHTAIGRIPATTALDVTVLQQRAWQVSFESTPHVSIEAGGTVDFEMEIRNAGNAADATAILGFLAGDGWSHTITPREVTLDPGQTATLEVTLTAPDDADDGDSGVLEVVPEADPTGAKEVSATVGARFEFGATLTLPFQSAVDPGDSAVLRVAVTNRGNAPDSYDAVLGPLPSGWSAEYPDGAESLRLLAVDPGQTASGDVVINVGSQTAPGNYQVSVVVSSFGDPEAQSTFQRVLGVNASVSPTGGTNGEDSNQTPAPLVVAIALVALAAAWRRRERKRT